MWTMLSHRVQITQPKSQIKSFEGMFFFGGIPLTIALKHAALEEQMTMAMMAEADGDKFVIGRSVGPPTKNTA